MRVLSLADLIKMVLPLRPLYTTCVCMGVGVGVGVYVWVYVWVDG